MMNLSSIIPYPLWVTGPGVLALCRYKRINENEQNNLYDKIRARTVVFRMAMGWQRTALAALADTALYFSLKTVMLYLPITASLPVHLTIFTISALFVFTMFWATYHLSQKTFGLAVGGFFAGGGWKIIKFGYQASRPIAAITGITVLALGMWILSDKDTYFKAAGRQILEGEEGQFAKIADFVAERWFPGVKGLRCVGYENID